MSRLRLARSRLQDSYIELVNRYATRALCYMPMVGMLCYAPAVALRRGLSVQGFIYALLR